MMMSRFNNFVNETQKSHMDDYGVDGENVNLITEAGFSRVLNKIENNDFVIITAYRGNYDKKENINRNRQMRGEFNSKKMGVYQVVGHWQECQDDVEYEKCPKNRLVDVIERSYIAVRPSDMSQDEFESFIVSLLKKFNQDAALIKKDGNFNVIEKTGNITKVGDKLTLNKISQAYSQYVKKMDIPFVFEGVEIPGSNSGRQMMSMIGIKYPTGRFSDIKHWSDFINEV